jgi:hypothetical protein
MSTLALAASWFKNAESQKRQKEPNMLITSCDYHPGLPAERFLSGSEWEFSYAALDEAEVLLQALKGEAMRQNYRRGLFEGFRPWASSHALSFLRASSKSCS